MRAHLLATEHWSLLASRSTTQSEVLTRIPHDDRPGSEQTYFFFPNRRHVSQFLGSSMVFIATVNAALAGLLTAAVAGTLAAQMPVTVGLGAVATVAYLAVALVRGGRRYFGLWTRYSPRFPTPPEG